MTRMPSYERTRARLAARWHNRGVSLKALSFGLIGVVNTAIDYGVFLLARSAIDGSLALLAAFDSLSVFCGCGAPATLVLIVANTIAWLVAVTGSYVMNSSITFAAESGRKLRWRAYFTFVLSGVAGWLANTAMLLVAVEALHFQVWVAKAVAILTSFVVNFSLSHFVVFRVRPQPPGEA